MSAADWYARRLAKQQPQPQAYAPIHPQQFQRPVTPERRPLPPSNPAQEYRSEPITPETFSEALAIPWQGGQARREAAEPCPQCGGPHYAVVHNKRGPDPAGHCFNCGYNDGMFQQGLESSWSAPGV